MLVSYFLVLVSKNWGFFVGLFLQQNILKNRFPSGVVSLLSEPFVFVFTYSQTSGIGSKSLFKPVNHLTIPWRRA